ncbi:MAG: GxxExxY protein [Bacteroidota bacterium]
MTKSYLNALMYNVTGAAIAVHKELGPGLLESVYHKCLEYELHKRNINFVSEIKIPIPYDELELESYLRADFFVERCLVVELKATEGIHPVHAAQVLTYLKLLNAPKGLLLNFNVVNIVKEGQRSLVTELYRSLPE